MHGREGRGAAAETKDAQTGRLNMLRLTVSTEEYLMIGEDVKLVFLGGTGKHLRIMIDAPREKNIVRSTVLEKNTTDPLERAKLPRYYAEPEHPEKYVRKSVKSGNIPREAAKVPEGIPEKEAPCQQGEQSRPAGRKPRVHIARGNGGRG